MAGPAITDCTALAIFEDSKIPGQLTFTTGRLFCRHCPGPLGHGWFSRFDQNYFCEGADSVDEMVFFFTDFFRVQI